MKAKAFTTYFSILSLITPTYLILLNPLSPHFLTEGDGERVG
ncbi:Ribonuclease D [Crocosphaera watsonii WH 0402]|uniref:Ribonuclease D n=2 Tax=Crocosphaera watsonii TaxID=263511 RepID=T2JP79_CROWT|nr:Ribonuclease D [Crocosphaera watsonii WH 0401]CCQ67040.1 Ribonuclease D [Crocosphaera watsonii WH 0402]